MVKSKKYRTRKTRTRNTRTRKTRTIRKGGAPFGDDNFVFLGYNTQGDNADKGIPIIVPKRGFWIDNRPSGNRLTQRAAVPSVAFAVLPRTQGNSGGSLFLIVQNLYEMPNIRNLDLYETFIFGRPNLDGGLTDIDGNVILPFGRITSAYGQRRLAFDASMKQQYYNDNRIAITDIERKYPGLFKPIFLTPQEVEEAIKNIPGKDSNKDTEKYKDIEGLIDFKLNNAISDILESVQISAYKCKETADDFDCLQKQIRQIQERIASNRIA